MEYSERHRSRKLVHRYIFRFAVDNLNDMNDDAVVDLSSLFGVFQCLETISKNKID